MKTIFSERVTAGMWELTLPDVLAQHARSRPLELAAVCGDTRLRWPELDGRARRLAGALAQAGVTRGDRVLWVAQGCHRVLEGLVACGFLGAVFCPVNWRQTSDELAFVLDDASPRVVFWQEAEIGDTVRAARAATGPEAQATWVCHDDGGYERFLAAGQPVRDVRAEAGDGVLMIYTSAFSGRPNGAVLSHRAVLAQDLVIAHVNGVEGTDVFLNSGPLFHLGTLMRTFATFHLGGTNVFVARV